MSDFIGLGSLSPSYGAKKTKKRKGRGPGSGIGRSCGRGRGGTGHRSGIKQKNAFEGGQMPLARRIPKRGFSNKMFKKEFEIVNIGQIQEKFQSADTIDPKTLKEKGLVKGTFDIKILAKGELKKKIKVSGCRMSEKAKEIIEKAGGEIIA